MKVSFYIRDRLRERFRKTVSRRTGDSKAISSEVQSLIQDSLMEDAVVAGFEKMKIEPKPLSSMQVVAIKPSVATSAETTLGEMRGRRHSKAIPRRQRR